MLAQRLRTNRCLTLQCGGQRVEDVRLRIYRCRNRLVYVDRGWWSRHFLPRFYTSARYEMVAATGSGLGSLDTTASEACWADWQEVVNRFLEAVEPEQREVVSIALADPYGGGWGLRLWVSSIVWGSAIMPAKIPVEIIEVYLADQDVIPLHDCCGCGLAVPVRPNKFHGAVGEPEKIYFPLCPSCNSVTGWYLSRSF